MMEFEKVPIHNVKHLRALNILARINDRPMSKVLVDGSSILNPIPYKYFKKLGRMNNEIILSKFQLANFTVEVNETKNLNIVDLTVGFKTLKTSFEVIKANGLYNLLLERDWIHANQCILLTLHQMLVF
ncbi:hypothetical protein BT93_L2936 [Corymbia citriodora subsp. variegata]|uniref:Uncharacterized protein n=1 Tax=Corymbia citriodora subsp. variegata TaxID=360336 RepID=A0A8T0CL02_CORYI|nr:hypothetical protein BT93_L2936 [Corymbia citriodora subsp. variegata]